MSRAAAEAPAAPAGPGRPALDRPVQLLQIAYFLGSGAWPVLHIRSFVAVTGPKYDVWLVRTFGALVAAVGASMLFSLRRGHDSETAVLGASSGAVLAACDVYYVSRGRISRVYLLDAALELAVCGYWLLRLLTRRRTRP